MAILDVLCYPDPLLQRVAEPVKIIDNKIKKLVDDMAETMYAAPGIGLAATQVGELKRLMVIDVTEEKNQLRVFINPEIIRKEGAAVHEEGCLSVPGFYDKVERAETVMVSASPSMRLACWLFVFSTKLTIWTATFLLNICRP